MEKQEWQEIKKPKKHKYPLECPRLSLLDDSCLGANQENKNLFGLTFKIVMVTHHPHAEGGGNKCTEVARKQNDVKDDTRQEITHWLCKSPTLGASQTESIKPDAKLVLLLLE